MSIVLMGLNHKSAPVEVRERVSLSRPQIVKYADIFRKVESYEGCAILSTCNRTEFYCNSKEPDQAIIDMKALVAERSGLAWDDLDEYIYIFKDRAAVEHLFRVAAGLDSMVLGESQIQGQVQDAYEIALDENLSDSIINTLFMSALTVGKRVRTETQIDRQAVSISSAAVAMAESFFGTLVGKTVLVLGAGETSELTSRHLISHGISSILVSNRTYERAQWLAEEIGAKAIRSEQRGDYLNDADIIISSTASPVYVLEKQDLEPHLTHRQKPLLVIDIAVPRDVDPEIGQLDHVTLYDLDDLQKNVSDNKAMREKEAVSARAIVDESLEDFYLWLDALWVVPTIVHLQKQVNLIKEREIERAKNRIDHITPREEKIIEQLANSIVNQWLHKPIVNMKALAGKRANQVDCYIKAINDLWDLYEDEGGEL